MLAYHRANNFVIDTIRFGCRILFISTPCRTLFHDNKSALENASFVESAISELVDNCSSVVEVPFVPRVVYPLSVSIQSSGKKRLILDLSHVNPVYLEAKVQVRRLESLVVVCQQGRFPFQF